jgi:hypothetical protein
VGNNTKQPKILLYYNFILMESPTSSRKNFDLEAKLDWFTIGTITLPKLGILVTIVMSLEFGKDNLTFDFPHTLDEILVDATFAITKVPYLKNSNQNQKRLSMGR